MDKQQLLLLIETKINEGIIDKQDLLSLVKQKEDSSPNRLIGALYVIGALLALVGIGILSAQYWDDIGAAGRICITAGISFVTYAAGWMLVKREQKLISEVMFFLSVALAPLAGYVVLSELGIEYGAGTQAIVAIILLVIYGFSQFFVRKNILTIALVGFGTWAYYAALFSQLSSNIFDMEWAKWATMLLGVSYMLIAYGLASRSKPKSVGMEGQEKNVIEIIYAAGTIAVLASSMSVGGIWDLITIALIFAAIYLSVYLRSRAMLIFGSLFLIGHVIKLTSEYFVDSAGWPVALIVCGFIVIAVGYMSFYLNKKFIKQA